MHADTSPPCVSATVASVLAGAAARLEAASIGDARLEAEVLLARALEIDRARLLTRFTDSLADDYRMSFDALLARRLTHEPLAYITGVREFYGIEIGCSPAALIPRPETELLVEIALNSVRGRAGSAAVADAGTGTGAVAIAIAANAPLAQVTATDASSAAIELAQHNAARAGVADRIGFRIADLLEGNGAFDVIVANLPYVSERDFRILPPEIRDHEPRSALVGGQDGTAIVARLLDQAPAHLRPQGVLAAELHPSQAELLLARAQQIFPNAACSVEKDLAGLDRVLAVRTTECDVGE